MQPAVVAQGWRRGRRAPRRRNRGGLALQQAMQRARQAQQAEQILAANRARNAAAADLAQQAGKLFGLKK